MKRVLLVDDEPDIAPLVAMCLEPLNIELIIVNRLSEALDAARIAPVDMVLLDLALGDEDGLEILPSLRSAPGLGGIPIVAFTAHDSRKFEALQRGVDSFVRRPFAAAELQAAVRSHLG
jgi:DNA-binding response OmpR family regulator